jgi:hypothetical protein
MATMAIDVLDKEILVMQRSLSLLKGPGFVSEAEHEITRTKCLEIKTAEDAYG